MGALCSCSHQYREIILNAVSLACGFLGPLILLANFTGRVRYIIALPLSIIIWMLSSALVKINSRPS